MNNLFSIHRCRNTKKAVQIFLFHFKTHLDQNINMLMKSEFNNLSLAYNLVYRVPTVDTFQLISQVKFW